MIPAESPALFTLFSDTATFWAKPSSTTTKTNIPTSSFESVYVFEVAPWISIASLNDFVSLLNHLNSTLAFSGLTLANKTSPTLKIPSISTEFAGIAASFTPVWVIWAE